MNFRYVEHVISVNQTNLVTLTQAVKSKIAYATDTWTTKQMVYTFACTVGSFIDEDWKLIERVVDFKPLDEKEHQGLFAGLAFVNGAKERGGLNNISPIILHSESSLADIPLTHTS